jgi:hypothetical protein
MGKSLSVLIDDWWYYPISAGSMGDICMLEPVAALELHALVVAVPGGVARHVQGVVEDVADVADVADSMFLCSISSLLEIIQL